MHRAGNMPCIVNAANEIAVEAFLNDRIGFNDIHGTIEETLARVPFVKSPGYEDYVATNAEARMRAAEYINTLNN